MKIMENNSSAYKCLQNKIANIITLNHGIPLRDTRDTAHYICKLFEGLDGHIPKRKKMPIFRIFISLLTIIAFFKYFFTGE